MIDYDSSDNKIRRKKLVLIIQIKASIMQLVLKINKKSTELIEKI